MRQGPVCAGVARIVAASAVLPQPTSPDSSTSGDDFRPPLGERDSTAMVAALPRREPVGAEQRGELVEEQLLVVVDPRRWHGWPATPQRVRWRSPSCWTSAEVSVVMQLSQRQGDAPEPRDDPRRGSWLRAKVPTSLPKSSWRR